MRQNELPSETLERAHLKKVQVTMPEGVRISPSAADGLEGCSEDQVRWKSREPAACPDASKVGSVSIVTPLLDNPVTGSVYLGSQGSDDPASGEMFRLFLVAEERGVLIKLKGGVVPDPVTGQLTATFDDNPQYPFSSLQLRLKSGSRAAIVLPDECGSYTTRAVLTAWNGKTVTSESSFEVDEGCGAKPFDPGFSAGAVTPLAGEFSPLVARVTRGDGSPRLGRINVTLPKGALADLSKVQLCGDAQVASSASRSGRSVQGAGSCPAASQIGTTTVGAGAGNPFYPLMPGTDVSGRVFLTGPYRAARYRPADGFDPAYGLAIEVPAVAGPFDLGTVMVRAGLFVDRSTAQVRVLSDELPSILDGVPLDVRDVRVQVDRPRFALNPTSCAQQQVGGDIVALAGQSAQRSARYQVGDCRSLAFRPRLGLRLTGRRQVTTGKHPGVKATVRQSGVGEAGISKAKVALPSSLALDPDNAQALCEYADGIKPDLENHCPAGSVVGTATARTPLLKQPLKGKVYFVKNIRIDPKTGAQRRTLPMIVVALRGEIAVNLRGESDTTKDGRLVNTFNGVPDAPISRFDLNINGGSTGILAVTRTRRSKINLCNNPTGHRSQTTMTGHNTATTRFATTVKTPCAKRRK